MKLSRWVVTASHLLSEAGLVASSALIHLPHMRRHGSTHEFAREAIGTHARDFDRRSPQSQGSDGVLSMSSADVEQNVSIYDACIQGISSITDVADEPGFVACYNILDWHQNMGGMFQADLRLFQFSEPTGEFANISANAMTVKLNYPDSTMFSILTNGEDTQAQNDSSTTASTFNQVVQYSLMGNLRMQLDLNKLNTTEIMSLLMPQIQIEANSNGAAIVSNLTTSEVVYFVVGEFKNQTTPQNIIQAANPALAATAIEISKGFVLPGTTFGIFPTGLIVTGAWCIMFVVAFGLGTIGRIRQRNIYRKRVAATTGRMVRKR